MAIKSFADTSAVSLAYAFSDAATTTEVVDIDFQLVPFTTEGFTLKRGEDFSSDLRVSPY